MPEIYTGRLGHHAGFTGLYIGTDFALILYTEFKNMNTLLILGLVVISMIIQWTLRSKFKHYSMIANDMGMTGEEVAKKMLRDHGIYDVIVTDVPGQLTDHYDPSKRTVNLSPEVFSGRSVAAAAIAAHECGHAVQHQEAYTWLTMRSQLVPVVNVSSRFVIWVLIAGMMFIHTFPYLLFIGIIMFAFTTLFSFITLPVEFDASRRALAWIKSTGIMRGVGESGAKDILGWAASTYVVAAISSLAILLNYIGIYNNRR